MTIQKLVRQEVTRSKEELPMNSSRFNEIKHTIHRVEKKISNKLLSEREDVSNSALQKVQADLEGQLKRVEIDTAKQIKALFEIVQASIEDEDSKISRFSLKKTKRIETLPSEVAMWSSSSDLELKQGMVCWER